MQFIRKFKKTMNEAKQPVKAIDYEAVSYNWRDADEFIAEWTRVLKSISKKDSEFRYKFMKSKAVTKHGGTIESFLEEMIGEWNSFVVAGMTDDIIEFMEMLNYNVYEDPFLDGSATFGYIISRNELSDEQLNEISDDLWGFAYERDPDEDDGGYEDEKPWSKISHINDI